MVTVNKKSAKVTESTTVAADASVAAPKAATTKKKGAAAKTQTPVAESTNDDSRKKTGLRKAQVRILQFLSKKADQEFSRNQISAGAPCDLANCTELLGALDPDKRAANDAKHFPSLVSLKLVKVAERDIDGKNTTVYAITAAGRKEAAKL